jgi:hypothetical protein
VMRDFEREDDASQQGLATYTTRRDITQGLVRIDLTSLPDCRCSPVTPLGRN